MRTRLYIGTKDRVLDIEMPTQDIPETFSKFSEDGIYINGGGFQYGSQYNGKSVEYTFNRKSAEGIEAVNGLALGKYGSGYIYYCDPFARNILPSYLSLPTKGRLKAPGFDKFAAVEESGPMPDSPYDMPTRGAKVTIPDNGFKTPFTFVVPDGCDIAVSVKGVPTANISFLLKWGLTSTTFQISSLSSLWDAVAANTGQGRLASIEVVGTGEATLYGLMLALVPRGSNVASVTRRHPRFVTGTGQSGCVLREQTVANQLFALDTPWEQQPFTFSLLETEAFAQ